MGGNAKMEFIENYIPLCRECHNKTEGREKELLYSIITGAIKRYKPTHEWTDKFRLTAYFKNNLNE